MKALVCSDLSTILNRREGEEFKFFPKEIIKKIESKFDVIWNDTGRQFTKEELIERVKDVDAVFTCWESNKFDKEILEHAPNLKIIAHLAGSLAPFVSEEVYDRGIKTIGANDMHFAESVAEAAILYSLICLRQIPLIQKNIRNDKDGAWYKVDAVRGLLGKTVGIVSYGAIADHFARMLQPFHCKIKVYSRSISDEKLNQYKMERASLEEIFSTCDVISVHTAWNKYTENMVSKELLKMIKPNAVLVNTARGKVIDEPALIEELKTGRFKAALDVFWTEPLERSSELFDLENAFLMPHCGGPTPDLYPLITSDLIDEVYDYLTKGEPLKSEIKREKALSMTLH